MPDESPCRTFHADGSDDYHVYDDCWRGRRIPPDERRDGDGGKRLCRECAALRSLRRPT